MNCSLSVAITAGSISRAAGGLFYSVRQTAQELHRLGVQVEVFSLRDRNSNTDLALWHPLNPVAHSVVGPRALGFSPALAQSLAASPAALLHTQGIWQFPSIAALRWKRQQRRPHIASPRGMLEPWAWHHQAWKKRPVWWLWEHRNLQSSSVLHATSRQEAQGLRALGLRPPIAVIPNGVYLPASVEKSYLAHERRALFLSRVHPKKGLLNLVAAWRIVNPRNWRMIICGPTEGGHRSEVERAVAAAGLASAFEFHDEVQGAAKAELLASADLFVLPTFSENFGIAIAEALAAGLPVLTTTGAPWKELEEFNCGWWIQIGVLPLAEALRHATSLSPDTLRCMGANGRDFVSQRFAWPNIAAEMKTVYEWVLGGGPKPECVVLDRMTDSLDIKANRDAQKYSRVEMTRRILWTLGQLVFRFSPRPCFGWRRFVLRCFGASVGAHVNTYPSTRIFFPWNLTVGDWSAIGEKVLVYNLGPVTIGSRATISHRAHLCAGTHDYTTPDLPLLKPPIHIGDQAWVCADAFVGPGVTVGQGAVVGARAVVMRDIEPWVVVAGNPARVIKQREIKVD